MTKLLLDLAKSIMPMIFVSSLSGVAGGYIAIQEQQRVQMASFDKRIAVIEQEFIDQHGTNARREQQIRDIENKQDQIINLIIQHMQKDRGKLQ